MQSTVMERQVTIILSMVENERIIDRFPVC